MRNIAKPFLLATVLSITLNSCVANPSPTASVVTPATITVSSTPTLTPIRPTQTLTQVPKGRIIVVTSADNSGLGTLRQAMSDAQPGDTINFDPTAFPPNKPTTIFLESVQPGVSLPPLNQGFVSIDASNAGVTLDGKNIPGDFISAIQVASNNNVIQGITFINFSGAAIQISGGQNNLIESNVFGNNNYGIGLWDAATSANRIVGNFIGVLIDGVTPMSNLSAGITIMEGAHDNSIGPDNHIAFNQHNGVEILDENSIGNRIFENSIHDNAMGGINLTKGGNTNLTTPLLMDFDLAAGRVSGVACSNCDVLIYSDAQNEGAQYEGRTVADNQGVFVLEKGSAFSGPVLTATATDEQGNTSPFSIPTVGSHRAMKLQERNIQLQVPLATKPSDELEDNRIGSQWDSLGQFDPGTLNTIQSDIFGMGLKRARLSANGTSWDHINWNESEFMIDPGVDDFFTTLADNGVTITYVLNFWDKTVDNSKNCPRVQAGEGVQQYRNDRNMRKLMREGKSRFQSDEEVQRYLEYVRFIVHHFKDRVRYYEIWNEPNINICSQRIEVDRYIDLVKQAVPVIRDEYPEALIKVGGVTPFADTEQGGKDYFLTLLESDIMSLVDAISWHVDQNTSLPNEIELQRYYDEYPSLVQEIKDTATSHGFTGEYVADEVIWCTTAQCGPDLSFLPFTEIVAAKYYARSIIMNLGMDLTVGLAGGSRGERPTIQNLNTIMAGATPISLPIEIQSEVNNVKNYQFMLPNGNYLVALWNDGVAVDDDPGVPSTLTIPGFADWNATGVDILNGLEQELITSSESGDLIIRDLLIKDYPIIIRLSQ